MRKIFILLFLAVTIALFTTETKAQQTMTNNEHKMVVNAIETKIAELEVKRAMDLPFYSSTSKHIKVINAQLINLRFRLAELTGMVNATKPVENQFTALQDTKFLKLTDSPLYRSGKLMIY